MEIKKKTRKPSVFRHIFQALFFAVTNGYVAGFKGGRIFGGENKWLCVPGLNCYSCPGALYACPIGSLQAVLGSASFKVSCYVFGFIMIVGALLGRLVCGFMCPFGFVQDLLYKIPFFKKVKNLPGHKYLKYLRYVVLVVFVLLLSGLIVNDAGTGKPWYCEYICPSGTLFAGIPLVAMNESLQASIGWRFFMKVAILIVILLLSVISFRPFCKYLCPLGAMYGLCNPISLYRYRVDEEKCVKCGACQRACGMDIKTWETPNSTECIRCGECKAACPTGAITTGYEELKRRSVRDLPAEEHAEAAEPAPKKHRKSAALIAPEEKKNGLRVVMGVLIWLIGLACIIPNMFFALSYIFNSFPKEAAQESYDLIHLFGVFGSSFLMIFMSVILMRVGRMLCVNKGRRTASLRALRLVLPAILPDIIVYAMHNIAANPLVILASYIVLWILPPLALIIFFTCYLEKKPNAAEKTETEENAGGNVEG